MGVGRQPKSNLPECALLLGNLGAGEMFHPPHRADRQDVGNPSERQLKQSCAWLVGHEVTAAASA